MNNTCYFHSLSKICIALQSAEVLYCIRWCHTHSKIIVEEGELCVYVVNKLVNRRLVGGGDGGRGGVLTRPPLANCTQPPS
jgi:hypothetical protein